MTLSGPPASSLPARYWPLATRMTCSTGSSGDPSDRARHDRIKTCPFLAGNLKNFDSSLAATTPLNAPGAGPAVAFCQVVLSPASTTDGRGLTRTANPVGLVPSAVVHRRRKLSAGAAGSLIFWVIGPAGSPRKRNSTSSPGLPPAGTTAVGRGKVPTCRRYWACPPPP